METSLKTGFAQMFSCCPKNLSCPKFGGCCSPPRPPGPYAYAFRDVCDYRGTRKIWANASFGPIPKPDDPNLSTLLGPLFAICCYVFFAPVQFLSLSQERNLQTLFNFS